MAYPRPRGDNPLNFEEYDPTPFSGGYDQTALYGRPKSPSAETCYPASDNIHQGSSVGSGYGSESAMPHGSGPKYGVDEGRPVYKHHDPPHGSCDDFPSGYGKPKPGSGYASGFQSQGVSGYSGVESGYGRPKTKPARHESEQGYCEFEKEDEGHQLGYGRPSNTSFFEEAAGGEGGFGGPKPAYSQGSEEGYCDSKPSYGSAFGGEGSYEGNYQKPPPPPPEESFGGGYGGQKPSGYESRYGDRPGYGGEQPADEAGYGGYRKNAWEEEGVEHHHGHQHHKHHWRNDDE